MESITGAVIGYFSGFWGSVELLGTIFNLLCVYFAARHNQITWLFGSLGSLIFGILFFEYKLYSDAILQIAFYLPMQIIGYMQWSKIKDATLNQFKVYALTALQFMLVIGGVVIATALNGYLMHTFTDASLPFADSLIVMLSIAAQILMTKKFWQSWALWVSVDALAIYVFWSKELFVVSGLYALFFVIAAITCISWYRRFKCTE